MQVISTNTFGVAKWVVSPTASQGTHTTIGAAIASASAGDTIWVRDGTYTENITLKNNVNIISFSSGESGGDASFNVILVGTITVNTNVNSLIQGFAVKTNNAASISITSVPTGGVLNFSDCLFFQTNSDCISNLSSLYGIEFFNCTFEFTGGTKKLFNNIGSITFDTCYINNGGGISTQSTNSGTVSFYESVIQVPLASSSAGSYQIFNCQLYSLNSFVCLTTSGTATHTLSGNYFTCVSTTAMTIGSGTIVVMTQCTIDSLATNAITGLGTLRYTDINFVNSSGNNVTTQTALTTQIGSIKAGGIYTNSAQPAFFAYQPSSISNATGNSTSYQLGSTALTKKFDRGTNLNTNGTFTAPIAGIYFFSMTASVANLSAGMTEIDLTITASSTNYNGSAQNAVATQGLAFNALTVSMSTMVLMAVGDTAVAKVNVVGGVGNTATVLGSSSPNTYFLGYLVA